MNELNELRTRISGIDGEMARLFEERMEVCRSIAAYKQKMGLPVRDRKTESEKIARQKELIRDDTLRSFYVLFLQSVMDISSSFQEMELCGMRVAYGGAEGAYASLAASHLFPQARLISQPDFAEAYRSVESGRCDCAVLPIENSIAGEVGAVMDLMYRGPLYINKIYDLPIRHRLLGLPGSRADRITRVVSHPQALGQCSRYLAGMHVETMSAANTSAAAGQVLETGDPTLAAIASDETAALFGLEVLEADIQNAGLNTTRFAVFSRSLHTESPAKGPADENFILVFTVRNEAGALASVLNIIGAHGYNMRSLRSRPLPDLAWNYYFYLEAEGNIHTRNGQEMLQELSALCAGLKLAGTFREDR